MGIFDAISSKISSIWGIKPRDYQEMLDIGHVCMLTCLRKELSQVDASSNKERMFAVDRVTQMVESLDDSESRALVHQNLSEQVIKMFKVLQEAQANLHFLTANATSQVLLHKGDGRLTQESRALMSEVESESNEMTLNLIKEKCGFCLKLKDSKIQDAGKGVFVEGMAEIGDVVAVYPGYVHLREHLRDQKLVDALFPDENFFLFSRYDGIFIDGRTLDEMPRNEFGLGHMVNHPPKNTEPNVIAMAYDFPNKKSGLNSFPEDLRHLIPNRHIKPGTLLGNPDLSVFMQVQSRM